MAAAGFDRLALQRSLERGDLVLAGSVPPVDRREWPTPGRQVNGDRADYPSLMELTVIGAGPAYTDRRGAAGASYLVGAAGAHLVLDLGQGAFPNLASTLEPSELLAILVSHLHPDHFIDLVPLRHYLRYEFDPPRRVRVLGPAGLGDRLDALHALPGFAAASLDVAPLSPGLMEIWPFAVEARRVTHTEESYAFRVSASRSAPARVSSTRATAAGPTTSSPLIRPGDTLLAEASFGAGPSLQAPNT